MKKNKLLLVFLSLIMTTCMALGITNLNAKAQVQTLTEHSMGDANLDGNVNTRDVVLIKQAIVGLTELTDKQKVFADVYADGQINTRDVVLIQQFIVGMEDDLGVHEHIFNQEIEDNRYFASEATCTLGKAYYYSCICGAQGEETFKVGDELGHNYGSWISNEDGTHSKVCGNNITHTITENCSGGTASCTEKAICENCGWSYGTLKDHVAKSEWVRLEDFHYNECSSHNCTEKLNLGLHNYLSGTCCIVCGFEKTEERFTVTWKNYDGTILEVDEGVISGVTPIYNGDKPIRASDNNYIYTFIGWSPEVSSVVGNITYTAQFEKKVNSFIISFIDDDGITELANVTVKYGDTAEYPYDLPTKTPTAQYAYTFEKWVTTAGGNVESDLTNIKENKKVYAKYFSSIRTYTVIFMGVVDDKDIELSVQEVEYGKAAKHPGDHYREGYRFIGWKQSFNNVVNDLIIEAEYIKTHTITFEDYNNTILDVVIVDDDSSVVPPVPVREKYNFVGWYNGFEVLNNDTIANIKINSSITFKAEYVRVYTVAFVDYNGEILKTDYVEDGGNAIPPNVNREGYTFDGWNSSFNNVKSDLIIKAMYTLNVYEVEFILGDGNSFKQSIAHGNSAIDPRVDNPNLIIKDYINTDINKVYQFTGWDKPFDEITENTKINAVYAKEIDGPILFVESKKIQKGSTTLVELGVYLIANVDVYGFDFTLNYNIEGNVGENSQGKGKIYFSYSYNEAKISIDYVRRTVNAISVDEIKNPGRIELIKFNIEIPTIPTIGEYKIDIEDGAYIINSSRNKQTLYVISGGYHIVS